MLKEMLDVCSMDGHREPRTLSQECLSVMTLGSSPNLSSVLNCHLNRILHWQYHQVYFLSLVNWHSLKVDCVQTRVAFSFRIFYI